MRNFSQKFRYVAILLSFVLTVPVQAKNKKEELRLELNRLSEELKRLNGEEERFAEMKRKGQEPPKEEFERYLSERQEFESDFSRAKAKISRRNFERGCMNSLYFLLLSSSALMLFDIRASLKKATRNINRGKEMDNRHKAKLLRVIAQIKENLKAMDAGDPTANFLGDSVPFVKRDGKVYPHIGTGIVLDFENIYPKFSPHLKKLLVFPEKNALPIATLFTKLIYDAGFEESDLGGESCPEDFVAASDLLPGGSMPGVCRHKAVLLRSLLRFYGIQADLVSSKKHVVVRLPEFGVVADPTNSSILYPDEQYYRRENHTFRDPFGTESKEADRKVNEILEAFLNQGDQIEQYRRFEDGFEVKFKQGGPPSYVTGLPSLIQRFEVILEALPAKRLPSLSRKIRELE